MNGLRGPGIPILKEDSHHPGAFGFETWFSVSNFFDYDPLISRQGIIEQHRGDSSEIIVREALKFLRAKQNSGKPFFLVIWFGSPHAPMIASEADRAPFQNLPEKHQHHLGELKAMDRSIGALRNGLRQLGIARNTLLWFNSDNGGLPGYGKETVGHLRGNKGTMYEGGLRVPGIIEWPAVIQKSRMTSFRAGTMDIFPTIAEAAALPLTSMLQPQDGISLMPLLKNEIAARSKPLFFHHRNRSVIIDGDHKLIAQNKTFELYNLANDDQETRNLYNENDPVSQRLLKLYSDWKTSLNASREGKDYVEGVVLPNNPQRRHWKDDPAYQPYFQQFQQNVH